MGLFDNFTKAINDASKNLEKASKNLSDKLIVSDDLNSKVTKKINEIIDKNTDNSTEKNPEIINLPEVKKSKKKKALLVGKVPTWDAGYFPDISQADPKQQRFFKKFFKSLENNKYIDVENNSSYLFASWYLIQEYFQTGVYDIKKALKTTENLFNLYSDEYPKFGYYLFEDLLILSIVNNNQKKMNVNLSKVINLLSLDFESTRVLANSRLFVYFAHITKSNHSSIVPTDIFPIFYHGKVSGFLTSFGKQNKEEVLSVAVDILNERYNLTHKNYLWESFEQEDEPRDIYYPTTGYPRITNVNGDRRITLSVKWTIKGVEDHYLKNLVRLSENVVRQNKGIPKIGEGWVSETVLFYQIKNSFPELKIEQHARPNFLAPQHYDIYIPKYRVALEYQGDQHYKAINIFGGEEALKTNIKRDEKKRAISIENNVTLIEVLPNYDLSKIIKQIEKSTKTKSVKIKSTSRENDYFNLVKKSAKELIPVDETIKNMKGFSNDELNDFKKIIPESKNIFDENDNSNWQNAMDQLDIIESLYKTDPENSNKLAFNLMQSGYRAPAVWERVAMNYRKLGDRNSEINVLKQAINELESSIPDQAQTSIIKFKERLNKLI